MPKTSFAQYTLYCYSSPPTLQTHLWRLGSLALAPGRVAGQAAAPAAPPVIVSAFAGAALLPLRV